MGFFGQENYSKKVLKHFRNPHNYGRIENADAIGKVGNSRCLIPETKIHANDKMKKISELTDEHVLTHDGYYRKILQKFVRNHEGTIIRIKNNFGSVSLTPEHMLFALKIPKRWKFNYTKNRKKLKAAWYHATDIEKGDFAVYPIMKEVENKEKIKTNIKKLKWDHRSKEIPVEIIVDDDFLRLSGYFLSEGCIRDKITQAYIAFAFNIKEHEYAKDVAAITKKIFSLDCKIKEIPERKTLMLSVYSAPLMRFFKNLFGKGAENKSIPHFMMVLPSEKQRSLISGLWRGDGYINLERKNPRAGYSTISYQLVQQIKTLLLRQGIVPSVYTEEEKTVKSVKHKKTYRIHVSDRDSLLKLANLLGKNASMKIKSAKHFWVDENYFYTPIRGIEELDYNGAVINLEVDESKSYTSDSFCIHNCGDVMWLYIKVKPSGRDVMQAKITDAKFETFGCVAAIATSSMVTDLTKGKTIEEALKITKDNIVEKLGYLPHIKIHCSMLAIDALHEAIYQYISANKFRIPKHLAE